MFPRVLGRTRRAKAFPAHAGMFPRKSDSCRTTECLPRARGDVSTRGRLSTMNRQPSPRTRGCFFGSRLLLRSAQAFPAHAGMFPTPPVQTPDGVCLPRARGDVSHPDYADNPQLQPSPRTRGCFLNQSYCPNRGSAFPAHAGMFLAPRRVPWKVDSLPRARGDVSLPARKQNAAAQPSPRTRGCFSGLYALIFGSKAFPAHAGMFLVCVFVLIPHARLPRARGDVSAVISLIWKRIGPSPRTRGCFNVCLFVRCPSPAFPAHAGMFLAESSLFTRDGSLPRARGDVSAQ